VQLKHVILAKIAITLVVWCTPLLAFPPSWFRCLDVPPPDPIVFARLVGMAYLALVVMYLHGWREARAGRRDVVAVRAGLVSNGGAALLVTYYGLDGAWDGRGNLGACMWVSAALAAGITVGLLVGRTSPPP
jgi:hypothetical protein